MRSPALVSHECASVVAGETLIPEGVRRMKAHIDVRAASGKARGTGLGLPTAKRLNEAQRGTISINCPPTGGTTVTVHLPMQ